MSPRYRRLAAAGVVGAVLLVLIAASRPADPPVTSFRIVLGLKDKEPTDWSGQVAVAGGEAVELKGWRFEDKDAVDGATQWKCRTRNNIAPGESYPLDPPTGKPKPPPQEPWPNGVVLTVRGAGPAVTLTLPAGEVKFTADDVPLGRPKTFLDGQVRVERLPATSVLRPPADPKADRAGAGRLPRLLGALQDRQTVSGLGRLSEGKGPRAAGGARRPGRRLVGADRSGRAGRSFPRRPGQHAWRHSLGRLVRASASTTGTSTAGPTRTASSATRCG